MSAFPGKRQRGREKATSYRPSFLGCYITGNPQEINILKISCIPCKQSGRSFVGYPMNFEFRKCLSRKCKKKTSPYVSSRTHWPSGRGHSGPRSCSFCTPHRGTILWLDFADQLEMSTFASIFLADFSALPNSGISLENRPEHKPVELGRRSASNRPRPPKFRLKANFVVDGACC